MPPAPPDLAWASLIVSTVVLLVAALLGWGEWWGRRHREPELSPEDARHFAHQDSRRWLGIVVLVFLAAGVDLGSRIPTQLGNAANPRFVGIWLAVFALIFLLLTLALVDWVALRRYAARHRDLILRERVAILRDEARRQREQNSGDTNGHKPIGDLFSDEAL